MESTRLVRKFVEFYENQSNAKTETIKSLATIKE